MSSKLYANFTDAGPGITTSFDVNNQRTGGGLQNQRLEILEEREWVALTESAARDKVASRAAIDPGEGTWFNPTIAFEKVLDYSCREDIREVGSFMVTLQNRMVLTRSQFGLSSAGFKLSKDSVGPHEYPFDLDIEFKNETGETKTVYYVSFNLFGDDYNKQSGNFQVDDGETESATLTLTKPTIFMARVQVEGAFNNTIYGVYT